jgi:hypothetical protein
MAEMLFRLPGYEDMTIDILYEAYCHRRRLTYNFERYFSNPDLINPHLSIPLCAISSFSNEQTSISFRSNHYVPTFFRKDNVTTG